MYSYLPLFCLSHRLFCSLHDPGGERGEGVCCLNYINTSYSKQIIQTVSILSSVTLCHYFLFLFRFYFSCNNTQHNVCFNCAERKKNSLNYKALLLESSITMEIEYKSLTHCLTHLNFLKLQSLWPANTLRVKGPIKGN